MAGSEQEQVQLAEGQTPAEAQNTETPKTVPYDRFQQVNAQLAELRKYRAEQEKLAQQAAAAQADAEKARLAEQQQWKELAEKNAKEAEAALRKAADLELRALRSEVIAAKKLPPELAKRLQGTTEAELMADADDLLKTLKSVGAQSQGAIAATPKPDGAGLSPDEKRKQAWRPTSL
jgi:hypothetical protein